MSDKKTNDSRRKLLKSLAAGSGAVVAGKSLPESWSKPVVDSIMLPAHAELTDDSGSSGDDELGPQDYFSLALPLNHFGSTSLDNTENAHLFADIANVIIPEAHASVADDVDMSVAVSGSSATVRFTNGSRSRRFVVTAPVNGDASGTPTQETVGCERDSGPESVELIDYTPGDNKVRVVVNASRGNGWSVDVPEAVIGAMPIDCS